MLFFSSSSRPRVAGIVLLMLCLALPVMAGCAKPGQMDRVLPTVATLQDAKRHFGSPSRSDEQPDGTVRHEWLLNNTYKVQGQWVRELSPWVRYDSDGYRVEQYRDVWKGPRTESRFCRLVIISDKNGKVLSSSREGGDCDVLVRSDPAD